MVQGIFTSWELEFLEKPETIFKKHLASNPTYPFVPVTKGLYVLRVRTKRWVVGLLMALSTIVVTLSIYLTSATVDEYIIFPILFALACLAISLYHVRPRTFVIDTMREMYEFYRGDKLINRGFLHNIYIQLQEQSSGGGDSFYQVILNGHHLDEEPITGATIEKVRLARLARQLAAKLNINYFDVHDNSRYHIIRHRRPERLEARTGSQVSQV